MQKENNIIKGEMPKGNARKLWTDSSCRILLMLIHKKRLSMYGMRDTIIKMCICLFVIIYRTI